VRRCAAAGTLDDPKMSALKPHLAVEHLTVHLGVDHNIHPEQVTVNASDPSSVAYRRAHVMKSRDHVGHCGSI
jgi:hypothetical protein